jgi:hypothetical protein
VYFHLPLLLLLQVEGEQDFFFCSLMMMSSVITNGNIVMKTINLNFTNQTWTLAVRGKDVCLSNYGISNKFSKTKNTHIVSFLQSAVLPF